MCTTSSNDTILAKSDGTSLQEHTKAVERYLISLDPSDKAARIAARYHDLGKCASGFQAMLRDGTPWGYRHEVLSALIYLLEYEKNVDLAVLGAILTHHRNVGKDSLEESLREMEILSRVKELPEPYASIPEQRWREAIRRLHEYYGDMKHGIDGDQKIRHIRLRGLLIASDHAASAGLDRAKRLRCKFKMPHVARDFQRACAVPQDVILIAPTGTGKTEASLLWYDSHHRKRRLFYVLPVRSSIHAMADRLRHRVYPRCADQVSVLHARDMLYAYREYLSGGDDHRQAAVAAKHDSNLARLVHQPVKVTTPYQLINVIAGAGSRPFEVGIVEMQGAAFIFDEIHAYDLDTLAQILVLMEVIGTLDGKVMVMSATLPTPLLELIRSKLGDHHLEDATQAFPPRHRVRVVDSTLEECYDSIRADLAEGKRVLVICNRVAQAQSIYSQFYDFPSKALLHSRFTYRDRNSIERRVIGGDAPQLLIATQVVEVSLDISYDTCYTEVAPVDDLLQRFGRVNRRGELGVVDVNVAIQYDGKRLRHVYDLSLVGDTAKVLQDRVLDAETVKQWLDAVYEPYFLSVKDKLEKKQSHFRSIVSIVMPYRSIPVDLEIAKGDTVEVLPVDFKEEAMRLMEDGRYLEAMELLVPVPIKQVERFGVGTIRLWGQHEVQVVGAPYGEEVGLDTSTTLEQR